MKGITILYASLLACLTGRAIAAAAVSQSTDTSVTAIELEDGLQINKGYTLNNTTDLNASNLTYVN